APYTANALITVPAGLVTTPGSVIVAEVEFEYESSIGLVLSTSRTLKDVFYLRPRRVTTINRTTDGDSQTGFGPAS
ncbi:MAG: pilus assembly protein, partial [Alphaproteobacteria bacterium]|nr:pilus assembly protein [Alphaproteobacteria bacterium]